MQSSRILGTDISKALAASKSNMFDELSDVQHEFVKRVAEWRKRKLDVVQKREIWAVTRNLEDFNVDDNEDSYWEECDIDDDDDGDGDDNDKEKKLDGLLDDLIGGFRVPSEALSQPRLHTSTVPMTLVHYQHMLVSLALPARELAGHCT